MHLEFEYFLCKLAMIFFAMALLVWWCFSFPLEFVILSRNKQVRQLVLYGKYCLRFVFGSVWLGYGCGKSCCGL
jgi:hypothetical protein